MRRYTINRTIDGALLIGEVNYRPWSTAEVGFVDNYPWYTSGDKQPTEFRLLYDDDAIYIQFHCIDLNISAETTELNGPVCLDSCVEMFASPDPQSRPDYFNLEINCQGTMLMGFGPDRHNRRLISSQLASLIEIVASESPRNPSAHMGEGWWVAARLSLAVVSQLAGQAVEPKSGEIWKGNFFRCGGKTDDQYACWNPILADQPDYHRPEQFGELHFA